MIHTMRARRSIRHYTEQKVSSDAIELLAEACLRSPTSKNKCPWEFVFVDDPELIASLSAVKPHGAGFMKHAALAVVFLGDPTVSDVWVEDCSIAAISLQYTAQSLGLGSCWVQIRKRDFSESQTASSRVHQILDIPEQLEVACIIAIGVPARERSGVPTDQLLFNKIHTNRYTPTSTVDSDN